VGTFLCLHNLRKERGEREREREGKTTDPSPVVLRDKRDAQKLSPPEIFGRCCRTFSKFSKEEASYTPLNCYVQ
jgi:hypothetical protein